MRCQALFAVLMLACLGSSGQPSAPALLKPKEALPKGWSLLVFETESSIYGGRIKVGSSDTCANTDTAPCHFAVPDGKFPILVDQALEYGDTTGEITVSGERIYRFKTGQDTGRAAARAFGGLIGALATQPEEGAKSEAKESGPLTNVRLGSRFDLKFVSESETGKAAGFVAPEER
jgi:hypothetical protein